MQSNGTLLTEELADFFVENGFRIGLSLDGTQEVHDLTRPYLRGGSSFQDVLRAVSLTRERNIGGGVIAVVTRKNIDFIDEIYDFFKTHRIHAKFNPLLKTGRALKCLDELAIAPAEYANSMVHLFNRWFFEDKYSISIDPFETIISNLVTGLPFGCNYSGNCQQGFISIGPQGDVYPCGQFDGEQEFHLGNINLQSMEEIDSSKIRAYFRQRTPQNVSGCISCDYVNICNSGCPHDAYLSAGTIFARTGFCAANKILFSKISSALEDELDKAVIGDINGRR